MAGGVSGLDREWADEAALLSQVRISSMVSSLVFELYQQYSEWEQCETRQP